MATWANIKSKIITLWSEQKIVPYVNIYRWRPGSQSNNSEFSINWSRTSDGKPFKLDIRDDHVALYSTNGMIDHTPADWAGILATLRAAMPWPEDDPPEETGTLDDAYEGLLDLEDS